MISAIVTAARFATLPVPVVLAVLAVLVVLSLLAARAVADVAAELTELAAGRLELAILGRDLVAGGLELLRRASGIDPTDPERFKTSFSLLRREYDAASPAT